MTTPDDKFYRAKIVKRIDYAPDLWMIRIDPGGEFQFAPGQYATLGLDGPEKRSERPYSIASSPHEKEIEFFFELVPQGELTPDLYTLQLGDELLMRKVPKGRFTLDTGHPGADKPFAGGDGYRCCSVCQLHAEAFERLERRRVSVGPQALSFIRCEPVVGVWIPRRTFENC